MSTQQSADLPYRVGTARVGKENARGRARRGHPGGWRNRRTGAPTRHFAALGFQLAADPGRARDRGRGADRRAARQPSPRSLPDADDRPRRGRRDRPACARTNTTSWPSCFGRAPTRGPARSRVASSRATRARSASPISRSPRPPLGPIPDALSREFFDLFIGVGRGELLPYASYYLTGFLQRASARAGAGGPQPVRHRARRGAARAGGPPRDPVRGDGGPGRRAVRRRAAARTGAFFERHLKPWAARFFADLETAKHARFYRPVGTIGRLFMEIEAEAFAMDA